MARLEKKIKLARLLEKKGGDGYTPILLQIAKEMEEINRKVDTPVDIPDNSDDIERLQNSLVSLGTSVDSKIGALQREIPQAQDLTPILEEIEDLKKLRIDVIDLKSRINLPRGGGQANRDIKVDGGKVLSPFTDINFIGGASSITSSSNQTTRYTDITLPFGTLNYRQAATDTTLVSGDYTVDCTAGVTATLPTAVGITGKMFDVKNTSASSVLVATDGSETIDGETSVGLNQYDSVTVQSDNTNWIIV